jgi:hypothetical protein
MTEKGLQEVPAQHCSSKGTGTASPEQRGSVVHAAVSERVISAREKGQGHDLDNEDANKHDVGPQRGDQVWSGI